MFDAPWAEKAPQIVDFVWAAKELFIILSESEYHDGRFVMRIFGDSEEYFKSIKIFTKYSYAEEFCRKNKCICDGKPLVGRIDKADSFFSLYAIICKAAHLGAILIDIDCSEKDAERVSNDWMLFFGGRRPLAELSELMTKEEYERYKADGRLGFDFGEIPLYEPLS